MKIAGECTDLHDLKCVKNRALSWLTLKRILLSLLNWVSFWNSLCRIKWSIVDRPKNANEFWKRNNRFFLQFELLLTINLSLNTMTRRTLSSQQDKKTIYWILKQEKMKSLKPLCEKGNSSLSWANFKFSRSGAFVNVTKEALNIDKRLYLTLLNTSA